MSGYLFGHGQVSRGENTEEKLLIFFSFAARWGRSWAPSPFLLTDDMLDLVQVFVGNQSCSEFVGAKVIASPEDSTACIPSLGPHTLSGPSSVTLFRIHQETTFLSSNTNGRHGTESKDRVHWCSSHVAEALNQALLFNNQGNLEIASSMTGWGQD